LGRRPEHDDVGFGVACRVCLAISCRMPDGRPARTLPYRRRNTAGRPCARPWRSRVPESPRERGVRLRQAIEERGLADIRPAHQSNCWKRHREGYFAETA
jgi:hypothetical protein